MQADLASAESRLNTLHHADPYPSPENVEGLNRNLEDLKGRFSHLVSVLRDSQIEPEAMEAARFKKLMESTISKLGTETKEKILLPEQFAFGFAPYIKGGAYPRAEHVERLFVQLNAVERLTRFLVESQVVSILSIVRDEFDQRVESPMEEERSTRARDRSNRANRNRPQPTAHRPTAAGVSKPSLHTHERLGVRFQGPEDSVRQILDTLSRSPVFVVIREVKLTNERFATSRSFNLPEGVGAPPVPAAIRPNEFSFERAMIDAAMNPVTATGPALVSGDAYSHDERVVAGRELVTAEVILDVFRFGPAQPEEASL